MRLRHPEASHRISFEVELNHHDRLGTDHPAVVPRLDRDNLRRLVFDDAAIGVFDVYRALREKSHVRVHAEIAAGDGEYPLLGTMLLDGHRLDINYAARTVELT